MFLYKHEISLDDSTHVPLPLNFMLFANSIKKFKKKSSSSQTPSMKSKKQRVERIESCVQSHSINTISNYAFASEKKIHNINGGLQNLDFLNFIPPGFRFHPTEEELIKHYLRKKVMNEPLELNQIPDVEVYQYNPEQLSS